MDMSTDASPPVEIHITVHDPDKYKWQTAYKKKKLQEDPEYRRKARAMTKAWQQRKYAEDPEYREKVKSQQRRYYQAHKDKGKVTDPD